LHSSRFKVKKKGMDYNADIPFEHKPALGFYDTSEEQAKATSAPVGQTLRRLENKRKPDEEDAERKRKQRKMEEGKKGNQEVSQSALSPFHLIKDPLDQVPPCARGADSKAQRGRTDLQETEISPSSGPSHRKGA
jgi:hypothetical protein